MAQTAVTSAVRTLGNLLAQEVFFLYGVNDQVAWVRNELQRMQCFLKDADAKRRRGDDRVKNWVREVTEVAYRAEDVIDTFMHEVERRRRRPGLIGTIKRYTLNLSYQMIARHKVGEEIASIRTKIREISDSRTVYGIDNLAETDRAPGLEDARVESLRRISPDVGDDMMVVGFDVHKKTIVSQLIDANNNERYVTSIVGMGGIGKTTLAKKVYNSPEIIANFLTRVWVTVSQDFTPRVLLNSIARKANATTKEPENMEEDQVKKEVYDFLKERKYFIVMDDIWTPDVWIMINVVLPDEMNGSRVLFTTRSEEVARHADPNTRPFLLPLLNYDQSWELFTKKVFPRSSFPKELNELGRRMVQRCAGLPLALLVLGGFLSTKNHTPSAWMQVEESIDWAEDGEQCMKILALSYQTLPNHHLKACYLYIASFPEDFKISASELTRLWIAEGLVSQKGHETLEDTARGYLEKFIQRSMIQVLMREFDGGVSKFQIHDLLREMCLAEAKQDMFFSIIPSNGRLTNCDNNASSEHNISSSRRLALYNLTHENCSHCYLPPNLRSLILHSLFFLPYELLVDGRLRILDSLKLLRVLDLRLRFGGFPREIKFMIHLRYLKLSNEDDRWELPSWIGNLRSLQTLDLTDCKIITRLPKELGELPNLRYFLYRKFSNLRFRNIHRFGKFSSLYFPAITTSTKLLTLKMIKCEQPWAEKSLPRLLNLRRLGLDYTGDGEVLCDLISKLERLVSLTLSVVGEIPANSIIENLSNNCHLVKLFIEGTWGPRPSLPEINDFPPNLTKLTLYGSRLEEDPMPVLEKLPNLKFLGLYRLSYVGSEMVCSTGGFLKLQKLELSLQELEDWMVEDGAFPELMHLSILQCSSLTMLPEGLQHVRSLMELKVCYHREEFTDRVRKDVGDDWYKVKHVPLITVLKAYLLD